MLREIKTFLTIQRCGTFAATAEELGMTQSAVSAQIKALEQYLGFKVFDRAKRGATLNAAGERLIPYAEQIVDLFEQMTNIDTPRTLSGSLNVGAIQTVQTGLLPRLLPLMKERAPQLDVQITQGVSYDLLGDVGVGRLAVAFVIKPPFELSQDFRSETVLREPYVLITPDSLPSSHIFEILATQPFIRYNHASFGGHDVQQFLKKQEIEVKEVLELDDLEAIVQFVKHGMGVALVPHSGIWTTHTEGLNVLELGENIFYREILAVSRQDSRRIAELNLLRECWEDAQQGVRAAPIICPDIPLPEAVTFPSRAKIRRWNGATPSVWAYQHTYQTLR